MAFPQISAGFPETSAPPRSKHILAKRFGLGFAIGIGVIVIAVFIASFFLDGMIRPRIEAQMSSKLKGYHVTMGHAHLQLLTLRLTLRRLVVVQNAHPRPPVADIIRPPIPALGQYSRTAFASIEHRPAFDKSLRRPPRSLVAAFPYYPKPIVRICQMERAMIRIDAIISTLVS